jgi:hypothetical protein
LTVADEKRQVGLLINKFIQTVSHGRDFEALLNFYVDARAAFTSIDAVMAFLVQVRHHHEATIQNFPWTDMTD